LKKEAKLSANDVSGVGDDNNEEDLRFSSLFTFCQKHLGFLEEEETRLE